jgi:hypothetical protein
MPCRYVVVRKMASGIIDHSSSKHNKIYDEKLCCCVIYVVNILIRTIYHLDSIICTVPIYYMNTVSK